MFCILGLQVQFLFGPQSPQDNPKYHQREPQSKTNRKIKINSANKDLIKHFINHCYKDQNKWHVFAVHNFGNMPKYLKSYF